MSGVIALGAAAGVGAGVWDVHDDARTELLVLLAVFCAAGNLFEIFMPGHWSFQPNLLFFFAGAILLPPWGVALLAVACFLPGWVVNRDKRPDSFPWFKVAFNIANYLLAGLVAHAIANAGDAAPAAADTDLAPVLALLGAALAFTVINHALIVVAAWQAGERSLGETVLQVTAGMPLDAALCLTGACFAVLWDAAPALVLLAPGPALLVHRALRTPLLAHTAETLRNEVGVLQAALLPAVPRRVGDLELSVAYRPAEGPAAGGDFYDCVELEDGKVAIVLGDVSGHGRDALGRSALTRYTVRAYLEAGLGPRAALAVASRALGAEPSDHFATVLVAVHDPRAGTLTCASAGHPPPIVQGAGAYEPVTPGSAPPIGIGRRTGVRQTTIPLRPGTVPCLYTDGITDAPVGERPLGREGLAREVARLKPGEGAEALIARIARRSDSRRDDMAACVIRAVAGPECALRAVEELDCAPEDFAGDLPERFLRACGVGEDEAAAALRPAREAAARGRGTLLRVTIEEGRPPRVELEPTPGAVESAETGPVVREPGAPLGADR